MQKLALTFILLSAVSVGYCLDFSSFVTRGYEGKGELEFLTPEDLLLGPAGETVVADYKNNRVQVIKANGQFERYIVTKEMLASGAADPKKLAKPAPKSEEESDEDEGRKRIPLNRMDKPVGLALDSSKRLYVSSSGANSILILNFKDGAPLGVIGKPGRGQGELNTPMDVDVRPDGMLAVADFGNKRVQLFDSAGKFVKEIHYKEEVVLGRRKNALKVVTEGSVPPKKSGKDGLSREKTELRSLAPRGVLWLPGGELLVSYPSFSQVACWDVNGNLLWRYGAAGKEKGELQEPSFLGLSKGNILIADSKNNRITEISPMGLFVKNHSGRGSSQGRVLCPRGLAMTLDDTMIVADSGNNRIHFFQLGKIDVILHEAKVMIEKDKWDDAMPKIEQALNLDPSHTEARSLLVNALHFFGDRCYAGFDFDKASEYYGRILSYNPNDLEVQPKLDKIFWAENKDLIMRLVFGIIGVIAALILLWVAKVSFNRLVFGHA